MDSDRPEKITLIFEHYILIGELLSPPPAPPPPPPARPKVGDVVTYTIKVVQVFPRNGN